MRTEPHSVHFFGTEPKIAIDLSDRHRCGTWLVVGRSRYAESGAGIEGVVLDGADQNSLSMRAPKPVFRHESRNFLHSWARSSVNSSQATTASDSRFWWRRGSSIPCVCLFRYCYWASSARCCFSWSIMPRACCCPGTFLTVPGAIDRSDSSRTDREPIFES